MIKYFTRCKVCGLTIEEDDLPPNNIDAINVYYNKKLIATYCYLNCLRKHFKKIEIKSHKKFLFFKYTTSKFIWVSRKYPSRHYQVIFLS